MIYWSYVKGGGGIEIIPVRNPLELAERFMLVLVKFGLFISFFIKVLILCIDALLFEFGIALRFAAAGYRPRAMSFSAPSKRYFQFQSLPPTRVMSKCGPPLSESLSGFSVGLERRISVSVNAKAHTP